MTKQARKRVVSIKSILTPEQIRIIKLHIVEERTQFETARMLGLTRQTVQRRIEAAFASVRLHFGDIRERLDHLDIT